MSIDLAGERLYPLRIACRFAPRSTRTGKPLHVSALARWGRRGLLADDGSRVFLEVVKAGAGLATSKEALCRFFAELTRRSNLELGRTASPDRVQSRANRLPQIEAARKRLDASGI